MRFGWPQLPPVHLHVDTQIRARAQHSIFDQLQSPSSSLKPLCGTGSIHWPRQLAPFKRRSLHNAWAAACDRQCQQTACWMAARSGVATMPTINTSFGTFELATG